MQPGQHLPRRLAPDLTQRAQLGRHPQCTLHDGIVDGTGTYIVQRHGMAFERRRGTRATQRRFRGDLGAASPQHPMSEQPVNGRSRAGYGIGHLRQGGDVGKGIGHGMTLCVTANWSFPDGGTYNRRWLGMMPG
jgi:hypothetical protein